MLLVLHTSQNLVATAPYSDKIANGHSWEVLDEQQVRILGYIIAFQHSSLNL